MFYIFIYNYNQIATLFDYFMPNSNANIVAQYMYINMVLNIFHVYGVRVRIGLGLGSRSELGVGLGVGVG